MKTYRILNALAWLILIACGVKFYALEQPFFRYLNSPFPVVNGPVRVGQAVQLKVLRCSSDERPRVITVSHTLDGDGPPIALPATHPTVEYGCRSSISEKNVIPLDTPPGRYVLYGTAEVNGRFQNFTVQWHSQEFEVIP